MVVSVIENKSLVDLDISDRILIGSVNIPFSDKLSLSSRMVDPKLAIRKSSIINLDKLEVNGHVSGSHYVFSIKGLIAPLTIYMVSDHYYSEFIIE